MGFKESVYRAYKRNNGGRCYMTFHECGMCGHKFTHLETIWKRLRRKDGCSHVVEYLCESCHDSLFIDL